MATSDTQTEESRSRFRITPLAVALTLAVTGLALIGGGLAWGVAPWVAMVVIGALVLGAAFLVDSPRRGPAPKRTKPNA